MSSADLLIAASQLDASAANLLGQAQLLQLKISAADVYIADLSGILTRAQTSLSAIKRLDPAPLANDAASDSFWEGPARDHFVPTARALNVEFIAKVQAFESGVRALQAEIEDLRSKRKQLQAQCDDLRRAAMNASSQAAATRAAAAQAAAEEAAAAAAAAEAAAQLAREAEAERLRLAAIVLPPADDDEESDDETQDAP